MATKPGADGYYLLTIKPLIMAKMKGPITLTGSLGGLSFYPMKGVEGLVGRTKGGASKKKIKKDKAFVRTRELNAEFGGRSRASGWIMRNTWPMKQLADYNVAGPLNALLKPIQTLDTQSPNGQHNILLSQHPQLLNGFSFNRQNTFDSTVRNPLSFSLDRATLTAQVDIPALLPGINLAANPKYPHVRHCGCAGCHSRFVFGGCRLPANEGVPFRHGGDVGVHGLVSGPAGVCCDDAGVKVSPGDDE